MGYAAPWWHNSFNLQHFRPCFLWLLSVLNRPCFSTIFALLLLLKFFLLNISPTFPVFEPHSRIIFLLLIIWCKSGMVFLIKPHKPLITLRFCLCNPFVPLHTKAFNHINYSTRPRFTKYENCLSRNLDNFITFFWFS